VGPNTIVMENILFAPVLCGPLYELVLGNANLL
jgi:hypothetical protein